nr:hypothetical protein CFP56_73208 [Quercus suber]
MNPIAPPSPDGDPSILMPHFDKAKCGRKVSECKTQRRIWKCSTFVAITGNIDTNVKLGSDQMETAMVR